MIGHSNELVVPEVSCYSRQEIEGGVIIRYLVRQPGEVEWQPVKVFRSDPATNTMERIVHEDRHSAPHDKKVAS